MRLCCQPVQAGGTVNSDLLIGRVVAAFLQERLGDSDGSGTARYLLDCYSPSQLAAIAVAVLQRDDLDQQVEIRLPRHYLAGHGLPDRVLTDERTTYWRNASFTKAILLVANTGDDEEQSLKELVPIGSQQLQADCGVWVRIAAADLPLTDTHLEWWSTALRGLVDSRALSLERMSDYVSATRKAIADEGHPIIQALGFALPSLHVPRDTGFFAGLTDKTAKYPSKWRALFASAYRKRACYLVKQTPAKASDGRRLAAGSPSPRLHAASLQPTVETFIHAAPGWGEEALALAENEWELIKPLFDGMKKEAFSLGKATAEFYDESHPDVLAPEEVAYLQRLAARKALDSDEDDADFYRRHRHEMKEKPGLKARWDKFIYGAPVEAEDFLAGLAECLESLFGQDQQGTRPTHRITI